MEKIPVGILGATGMVGQKFAELLANHPWFEIVSLAASDRSVGKSYKEVVNVPLGISPKINEMCLAACQPSLPCKVVFSGLDSKIAGEIEESFARAGYIVISNSSNHRMHPKVPLIVPEINSDHLQLLTMQDFGKGAIITNPNCSVIGIALVLKPLLDLWGIESVHAATLQAISGAGYPGMPSLEIIDNVVPFIAGEEIKIEQEPLKIMGNYDQKGLIQPHSMRLSAQCTRVPVTDGHLACLSVKLKRKADMQEIIAAWRDFTGEPQRLELPMAPKHPIIYLEDEKHPQPKLHRYLGNGMAVSVGRLRKCPLLDWKFTILSHNTIRGAAGCALLNAELMYKKGYL